MPRQAKTLFLEEWLRINSGGGGVFSSAPARAIIQAWSELRDALHDNSFLPNHLKSLKTLVNSQMSLHVAEPQAKLLLSILSSRTFALPSESYPLLLRLLYIWVRKSFRPSTSLVDSAVDLLSVVFKSEYGGKKSPLFFAEAVLLLGAMSLVRVASDKSKVVCLELLCSLLEQDLHLVSSNEGLIRNVLAAAGYALCSSVDVRFLRILDVLLACWGKADGLPCNLPNGLMILHLFEWVVSGFIRAQSVKQARTFSQEVLESSKSMYSAFALVMVAAGVLRASSGRLQSDQGLEIVSRLRRSAENQLASIAEHLVSVTGGGFSNLEVDFTSSLLLQCISVALARSGTITFHASLFLCLASALLTQVFPLQCLYKTILNVPDISGSGFSLTEVKEHVNSIPFKEGGAITGVFCNQYVLADEKSKSSVENMVWGYSQNIYKGHRQSALLLRGKQDELLGDMEKIAESAFLMVVVFALAVTKQRLNSNFSEEAQKETSVRILVSFSCLEYFRRIRLPEYMDTIRAVVASVQQDKFACASFVESMPSYVDLTSGKDSSILHKLVFVWSKDEVQTARILFCLRVIPTCVACLPASVFRRVVAPIMFLYMGHPNTKVARATHSMFVAFISSGVESRDDESVSLKEKLVFYYIQRSLEGYPGFTPFEGMASGVAALVQHLPAGSPAIFYCIHSLVEKANWLCIDAGTGESDAGKNWLEESEPRRKFLELLIRLISLVDIQVLPTMMTEFAQLIVCLPKDGQIAVLNELYEQVAESDDVTRKPTLVSWLQSLSYLSSQDRSGRETLKGKGSKEDISAPRKPGPVNWDRVNARL